MPSWTSSWQSKGSLPVVDRLGKPKRIAGRARTSWYLRGCGRPDSAWARGRACDEASAMHGAWACTHGSFEEDNLYGGLRRRRLGFVQGSWIVGLRRVGYDWRCWRGRVSLLTGLLRVQMAGSKTCGAMLVGKAGDAREKRRQARFGLHLPGRWPTFLWAIGLPKWVKIGP